MNAPKRETTEAIEMPNQERIRTLGVKKDYMHLRILEANIIEKKMDERKNKRELHKNGKKSSLNQVLLQKSHQKYKLLGGPHCNILWRILKMDEVETLTN